MGLYQQRGYKRLAIVLSILAGIGMAIYAGETGSTTGWSFLGGLIYGVVAIITIRLVYWVIDGFRSAV